MFTKDTLELFIKAGSATVIGVFAIWTMGEIQTQGLGQIIANMERLTARMDLLNGIMVNIQGAIMEGGVCRERVDLDAFFQFDLEPPA